MGYYRPQGDYYAGYRGDPGIGSFFGGLLKSAVGFIPGVGPIASKVLGAVMPGGAKVAAPVAGAVTAAARGVAGAIVKHPVLSAAGAAGALGGSMMVGAAGEHLLAPGGTAPRGYHLCKGMRPGTKHPHPCKTGAFVRNRRMNVCNPRALRRAIRRAHGFTKLAMKTIHLTHPKKKGRFGGFKKKRRS